MADSISANYAGDEAAGFISASLLSGDTLGKGAITVLPNVSYKVDLKKFDLSTSCVKDATCDFTDAGDVTYAEKALTPEGFAVNKQLCKKDWLSTYAGASMNVGVNATLPANFEEYIISNIGAVVGQQVETSIWQGATSSNGEFDGFATQCTADGDVVDVVGTTLTAGNIIVELGKVRDVIPAVVYGKEDLAIYIGSNAMKFYISAQAALGYLDQFHAGTTEANFEGIKLIVCSGIADNEMFAARKSNLFFATDLAGDLAEVKMLDMADKDGSDNVRVVMKWNAGVGYANGTEIVYYT
jgi:hypothetical protein